MDKMRFVDLIWLRGKETGVKKKRKRDQKGGGTEHSWGMRSNAAAGCAPM